MANFVEVVLRKAADWMSQSTSRKGRTVAFTEDDDVDPDARDSSQSGEPEEIYKSVPWIYAGITQIVQHLAAVPLIVTRKVKNKTDTREPVTDTWVNKLIAKPNEHQSWYDIMEALFSYMELRGMSFFELVGENLDKEPPVKMYELRADRMEVIPDPDTRISGFAFDVSGIEDEKRILDVNQVLYTRYFNPTSEQEGLSAIDVAFRALQLYDYADEAAREYYEAGGRPEGVLKTDATLTEPMLRKARRDWNRAYSGRGRNRTAILQRGLEYKAVGDDFDSMDVWTTKHGVREEVLAAIGVPPVIVGVLEGSSYANARQQKIEFLGGTLQPKMRKFLGAFNLMVHRYNPELNVEADYTELLLAVEDKDLQLKEREINLREVELGALTRDEYRRDVLSAEPLPNGTGEIVYLSTSMAPIDQSTIEAAERKSSREREIEAEEDDAE